jgi:hypothetical protein
MSARRKTKPEAHVLALREDQEFWRNGAPKNYWTAESEIYDEALIRNVFPSLSCVKIIKTLMRLQFGAQAQYGKGPRKTVVISQANLALKANVSDGMVIEAMKQVCPPGIVIVKKHGNQNSYEIDMIAMALAPTYEQPAPTPLKAVPYAKPAPGPMEPHKVIAAGKIAAVLFRIPLLDRPGEFEERIMKVLNRDSVPIAVACTLIKGEPFIEVWRHGFAGTATAPLINGEEVANDHPNALRVLKRTHVKPIADSKRVTGSPSDNTYYRQLKESVEHFHSIHWASEDFRPDFIARIAAALGDTPVEHFAAIANRELNDPENFHRSGPLKNQTKHPSKRLVAFANQAARAWQKGAAARAATQNEKCPGCGGKGGKCPICHGYPEAYGEQTPEWKAEARKRAAKAPKTQGAS